MKIDIHTHTKKTKTGDSINRNIDGDNFAKIIKETDVEILAITNHNHFDIEQYNEFIEKVAGYCLLWPGVELDILEDGRRGHLLVLVNPQNAELLANKMNILLEGKNADNFCLSINETIQHFETFDSIFIAHYYSKNQI